MGTFREQHVPFRETGDGAVPLGQGGHDLGVLGDESGVDALHLDEIAHQLVEKARGRAGRAAVDVVLHAEIVKDPARLSGIGEKVRLQAAIERLREPRG